MGLTYRSRLALLLLLPQLLSCGGGDDDDPPADTGVGPEGGELTVPAQDAAAGFKVVIAPGALAERRFISIDGFGAAYPPTLPNPGFVRAAGGAVGLRTRGAAPYGLVVTVHAPLADLAVADGEMACLFGYDAAADRWQLLVPQALAPGATTLTVATTYHDFFAWGKIVVNEIPAVYLAQAVDGRYGAGTTGAIAAAVAALAARPERRSLAPSRASLLALRNGFLETYRLALRDEMVARQQQIGCGTCDVLSRQFIDDAFTYVGNRIRIEWWSMLAGNSGLFIVDVLLYMKLIDLYAANDDLPCDYKCFIENAGPVFWEAFTGYCFALLCQELIDLAIEEGWVV